MAFRIRAPKDFWAGALYVAFGLSAVVIGRDYGFGTTLRMGPAYFPAVLGAVLTVIGTISVIRSFLRPGEPVEHLALKPLALITVAILLFGFLVRGAGLVVVVPLLVMVTAYGRHDGLLCDGVQQGPGRSATNSRSLVRPIAFLTIQRGCVQWNF